MNEKKLNEKKLDDIFKSDTFDLNILERDITEKERFIAAKQILLGIAILYTLTLASYILKPDEDHNLINILSTIFPSLGTLILGAYFGDRIH